MKGRSIVISAIAVIAFTFLIKVLGILKQSVLAYVCGATLESDIFFVATGIISQLSVALFSAISISLLTTYSRAKREEGNEKADKIVSCAIKVFIPTTAAVVFLINLLANPIARFLAPSYDGESLAILATYLRILSVALVPSCFYLIINVCLENCKIFLPGKMQGLFLNLFLIIAALALYDSLGIISLIIAFIISLFTQAIFILFVARNKFKFSLKTPDCWSYIKRVLILSLPLIVGNAAYEINDIIDKQIALGLGSGAASVLNYGAAINEIVTGLVVSSVSVVVFANFVTLVVKKEFEDLTRVLNSTLLSLIIFILPIMIVCIFSGDTVVRILYGRGKFSDADVDLTYKVVLGYSAGFIFQAFRAILVKVYYAFNKTAIPTVTGVLSVVINIILNFILSKYFGVLGIALATSISMAISSIALLLFIRTVLPSYNFRSVGLELVKSIAAIVLAFIPFYLLQRFTSYNLYLQFIVDCSALLIAYIGFLVLFRSKIILSVFRKIKAIRARKQSTDLGE